MTTLSASTLTGNEVVNRQGENLGEVKDVMIDVESGKVTYAVLEFGGFLGLGAKLFAVPINAMELDTVKERFVFDQSKERLESAPGFDKDNWPDFADRRWEEHIHTYYNVKPHWH